jgi:hypothetical protein
MIDREPLPGEVEPSFETWYGCYVLAVIIGIVGSICGIVWLVWGRT